MIIHLFSLLAFREKTMSKVLFFNLPALGHTNPTLPLVAELVRRGEQVIYYSSPAFQQAIEQTGATFRDSVTPFLNDETQFDENMIKVAYLLLQATSASIALLLPLVREDKPDYIIHDGLCSWGKYIAQMLEIPAICSMTTFAVPLFSVKTIVQAFKIPGNARLLFSTPMRDLARTIFEGRGQFMRFRALSNFLHKAYGIPKLHMADLFANRALMNIVYTTRQFQPFEEMFDTSFKFVGPSIVPRPDSTAFPFDVVGDAPIIYISLGTVFNDQADFYRTCLEAFADSDRKVVLSVGKWTNIAALGSVPRNIIVREFVPQLELLQRTALFVTHGGMNSVSEALYYGVPFVVIPQTADQNLVGQRIEQLGAGKTMHKARVTAQRLRAIAEEMLAQPSYAQASARLGKSFGQPEGYLRAADEISTFKQLHGIH